MGMKLIFTKRKEYPKISHGSDINNGLRIIPDIPSFRKVVMVSRACRELQIHELIPQNQYDWIVCACGTGTMMAGLLHTSTA